RKQEVAPELVSRPRKIAGLNEVHNLVVGRRGSCAQRLDGSVYCWGRSWASDEGAAYGPVRRVSRLHGARLFHDSMSDEVGAVVDGRLLIDYDHGPMLPSGVEDDFLRVERIDLGAGKMEICIVSSTRSPVCAITGAPGPTTTTTLVGVRDLALCLDRPCTITNAGAVECGRIIDGAFDRMAMIDLPAPAVEIACIAADTCVRLSDGSVYCWTDAKYHKISTDPLYSDTPMRIPLKRAAGGLVAGFRSACARSNDGRIECWGDASSPSLADVLQR